MPLKLVRDYDKEQGESRGYPPRRWLRDLISLGLNLAQLLFWWLIFLAFVLFSVKLVWRWI